jgi:hypothetical protein
LERSFCIFGFAVAALLILTFGLDLITAWPFWRASVPFDIAFVACGAALAYVTWDSWRAIR